MGNIGLKVGGASFVAYIGNLTVARVRKGETNNGI
jgi:hypothetical protein